MTRNEAYNLMTQMLKSKNLQKHGLEVEAIMRALCQYLKQNVHDREIFVDNQSFRIVPLF